MIMSMLTDDQIMNPNNIAQGYNLFSGKSVEGQGHDDVYGEIHTGNIWDKTVDRFCGNHPQNMPLGLVIFGDNSHLDLKGALSTIPIIFTFTCFNHDARNKVENWRPLLFLPNLSHGVLSSKNKNSTKRTPYKVLRMNTTAFRLLFHPWLIFIYVEVSKPQ
jgi:hypothetical protein